MGETIESEDSRQDGTAFQVYRRRTDVQPTTEMRGVSMNKKWSRRTFLGAAPVAMFAVAAQPAAAAVSMVASIVQELGEYEARFPDIVPIDSGLMAVWYRATAHSGTAGTIQLSFGDSTGRSWSAAGPALANPATMAGIDTRDPKLGKMKDGSVVMTIFVPGGKVYYSVWKPGWTKFTDPVQLTGLPAMYSHGPALALDDNGSRSTRY